MPKLTDALVRKLPTPKSGYTITQDDAVKGFGILVTAAGSRSFILRYRTRTGRSRRYTIGSFPDWTTVAARTQAAELKRQIDGGEDPMGEVQAHRDAKTMADLCERFQDDHLPRKRASTVDSYARAIRLHILPAMRNLPVADVGFADVDALHRKLTRAGGPYIANRTVSLLSKMFALAKKWKWRTDNPCQGIERNVETKRQRYLSADEIARLAEALAAYEDQNVANAIRLLLLTGARRGEVLAARWDQLDLERGAWTKPGSMTKQKTVHNAPLGAPARALLADILATAQAKAKKDKAEASPWVFPSRGATGHLTEIKRAWASLCKTAKITGARPHDLRHTFASVLVSAGQSLPVIGALLGHSNPTTTARYAHLMDDPLRQAADRAGSIIIGKPSAEVIPLRK